MAVHRQLTLCRRVRGLREQSGYTQAYLANVLGISQAAYSRFERGNIEITLTKLFILADLYGISLAKLLDGV